MADAQAWAQPLITFILGGGLVGSFVAVIKARPQARKITAEADALDLTTEAQAESVAMSTMRVALESAQSQVHELTIALTAEREGRSKDREEHRVEVERLESRIAQLVHDSTQLQQEVADYRRHRFPD